MSNAPSVKITVTIEPRAESNLQKTQSPFELPPNPIPVWPAREIRTAPGLHPYEPTKWRAWPEPQRGTDDANRS